MTEENVPEVHFDAMQMIYEHARKCGLTPYKLVLEANMDPSCLSRWRRGGLPNGRTMERLLAVPMLNPVPDAQ